MLRGSILSVTKQSVAVRASVWTGVMSNRRSVGGGLAIVPSIRALYRRSVLVHASMRTSVVAEQRRWVNLSSDHGPVDEFAHIDHIDEHEHPSVSSFITAHIDAVAYDGDASFLAPPTEATLKLWAKVEALMHAESDKGGVLDVDPHTPSTITSHKPGYIDKELEQIVGLQTDAPLKRAIKPLGGWRMVKSALESYGYDMDAGVQNIFSKYRKTHNEGVFDIYTAQMRQARKVGILTGLPDAYGRGRIIGDYRRIALYGVDALVSVKEKDKHGLGSVMTEQSMQLREEVAEQIHALKFLKEMAAMHGFDISLPAKTAKEATQWVYFGYLAAIKEQDGAAMSLGKVDSFLDIYFTHDLANGTLKSESEAQEIIDHFVMKLRMARHLRPPEYNKLFAGDPTWVTAVLGGAMSETQHMVTKTSYRILHTLNTLGPAPEPNLTVLWCPELPTPFKEFCAKMSIDTSSIQYENDMLMRANFGCDYGIACCVSAMGIGKEMQFFGARCNLPKLLLYAINEGRDENTGENVAPNLEPVSDGTLQFDEVINRLEHAMDWLSALYANTMNVIHFSHDKYNYEGLQMSLHDTNIRRYMAYGIAGLSVIADSLSAIKFAKVTPIRDANGIAQDFKIEGEFPTFGNDDTDVDTLARWVISTFMNKLRSHYTYRHAVPTMSALTITSNVVYGNNTGNTPDGRKRGEPYAPGANPMHGRDKSGAIASLNSVGSLPYNDCLDGISNTFSVVPAALGKDPDVRISNLVSMLNGYFSASIKGQHLNVNVFDRETLVDAMEHPEKYPALTIRVSGYAVHFIKLSREQQMDVISRTFHKSM